MPLFLKTILSRTASKTQLLYNVIMFDLVFCRKCDPVAHHVVWRSSVACLLITVVLRKIVFVENMHHCLFSTKILLTQKKNQRCDMCVYSILCSVCSLRCLITIMYACTILQEIQARFLRIIRISKRQQCISSLHILSKSMQKR